VGNKKAMSQSKNQAAKPKIQQQPNQKKTLPANGKNNKIKGKNLAIGAVAAGGAAGAVMAMPAVMPEGYDALQDFAMGDPPHPNFGQDGISSAQVEPYLDGNLAPDVIHCMLPYEPFTGGDFSPIMGLPAIHRFPPMTPHMPFPFPPPFPGATEGVSDDPPEIPKDVNSEDAKAMKIQWLAQRALNEKPYDLADLRLNLSEEDQKEAANLIKDMKNSPAFMMFKHMREGFPATMLGGVGAAPSISSGVHIIHQSAGADVAAVEPTIAAF
jgi:hypothetical protein